MISWNGIHLWVSAGMAYACDSLLEWLTPVALYWNGLHVMEWYMLEWLTYGPLLEWFTREALMEGLNAGSLLELNGRGC